MYLRNAEKGMSFAFLSLNAIGFKTKYIEIICLLKHFAKVPEISFKFSFFLK